MPTKNFYSAFTILFKSSNAIQVYRLSGILLLFVLLNHAYLSVTHLKHHDFQQTFLFFAVLQRLGWLWISVLIVTISSGLYYGRFFISWSSIDNGLALRSFITLLSAVLGISFAIQAYNFYFSQGYVLDRLLLLFVIALVYWRPVFVFAFLVLLLPLIWQWNVPLGGYLWGTVLHVIQVLILFCAWLLLNAFNRHQHSKDFIFFSCCLMAAVYWSPGLLKLKMNWLEYDRISYMPLAAYAHGWLTQLDYQQIVIYAKFIAQFEKILHVLVLAFELAALVCLWRRKFVISLLIIASLFHCAVFAFYGYFMWLWVVLDIALLLLFLRIDPEPRIFTPQLFFVSIVLIFSASWWLKPARLAWYNTSLTYTYRYQATGVSGKVYNLAPSFFTPYGDIMTMADFRYISPEPWLVGSYGISQNLNIVTQLQNAKSAKDVFFLEQHFGQSTYNTDKAKIFYAFIADYISHYNDYLYLSNKPFIMDCCNIPAQFWSLEPKEAYKGEEPIKKVTVLEITTFYDNVKLKEIRQRLLNTIYIP